MNRQAKINTHTYTDAFMDGETDRQANKHGQTDRERYR